MPAVLVEMEAAVTEPWSNGPVEGHVNRLKTLERQMYGRAGVDRGLYGCFRVTEQKTDTRT